MNHGRDLTRNPFVGSDKERPQILRKGGFEDLVEADGVRISPEREIEPLTLGLIARAPEKSAERRGAQASVAAI